jgi:hypothetical protein
MRALSEVLIREVGSTGSSNTLFGNYTGQVVRLDIAWTTIRRRTLLSDSLMQNGFVCSVQGEVVMDILGEAGRS